MWDKCESHKFSYEANCISYFLQLDSFTVGLSFRSLWQQQQRHHRWLRHQQRHRRELSQAFCHVLEFGSLLKKYPDALHQHGQWYQLLIKKRIILHVGWLLQNRDENLNSRDIDDRSHSSSLLILTILILFLKPFDLIVSCFCAEIFADEKCSVLNNPTGIFAKCHGFIPTDQHHTVRTSIWMCSQFKGELRYF